MEQYVAPIVRSKIPVSTALSSRILGKEIQVALEKTQKPTLIYVKWSQNTIFLEEGIKEFLADLKDEVLLCRQSDEWKKKKEEFFRKIELPK